MNTARESVLSGSTAHPPTAASPSDDFPAIYARSQRFTIGLPRNITVIVGAPRVFFLRSHDGQDPAMCLWQKDLLDGTETPLACPKLLALSDDSTLSPAEKARRERARESATGIVSYAIDRAGSKACFALAGALFILDLTSHDIISPTVETPVFDPRLSPDGTKVAYVSGSPQSENSLRLLDLETGSDRFVAYDTDPLVSFGRADFIAAEEMQRQRGFWWSPDSDGLIFTRVDERSVDQWWVHDPALPDKPPTEIRYPAAGTINADVDLYYTNVSNQASDAPFELRQIYWSDQGSFEYMANVVWTEGHAPLVIRQTRDQCDVSIAELDMETLTLSEKRQIQDDTWVELFPSSPTPSQYGLLTIEDIVPLHQPGVRANHPGCRALLLDGRKLTADDLQVRSIIGVIDRYALITAWTEPSEVHLLLVDLSSDPSAEARTTALTTNPGVHDAVIGTPSSSGAMVDYSAGTVPSTDNGAGPSVLAVVAVTTTRPSSDGVEVAIRPVIVADPENDNEPTPVLGNPIGFIDDVSIRPPIRAVPLFYQLGADRLESAIFFPDDFRGDELLPVLLDPYGGPHAQRVLKHHNPHLVSQWFADQGFVVVVTDGRGTPGRGPRWERQVWGDLAGPVLEDQLAALDDAAAQFGFLDLGRVAIRGWSFGGYLAALAVLRRPDRFHAAIAGAPVTTWRLYDTHYTERYLGHPAMYPQNYVDTDLTAEADKLERPLLLIHGLVDDNVVAAHTLRMSAALLAAGKPHQVLPLSGVTHMTPQLSVAENLLRLQLEFLRSSLKSVAPIEPSPGL